MKLAVPAMRDDVRLDPHQVDGIMWMTQRSRFLLGWAPGLGKSLGSMAFGATLHQRGLVRRILVVSPASLKLNFAREVAKFTHFRVTVLEGDKRKRTKTLDAFDGDVLIVSYEQVVAHADDLNWIGFEYVVVDEAHYVKNPEAKRTQALMSLSYEFLALMTGTPLENSPNELWTLLEMINPGGQGSYAKFKEDWCIIRNYTMTRTMRSGRVVEVEMEKIVGCTDPEALHRVLEPHMLRLSSDVLELTEPRFIPVEVPMTSKQRKLYDQAEEELGVSLTEEFLSIPDNQVLVLRLRQIASGTSTVDPHLDESAKLDAAADKLEEIMQLESHAVVFAMFKQTVKSLRKRLAKLGIASIEYTGDMTAKQRDAAEERWHREGGVLVATQQSAGTGLTLTDARSLLVIEKPYTPSKYEQAYKRVWRRGQKGAVMIYEFACIDSIDEVVNKMHERKQRMADQIVDGVTDEWSDVDLDEWLETEGAA